VHCGAGPRLRLHRRDRRHRRGPLAVPPPPRRHRPVTGRRAEHWRATMSTYPVPNVIAQHPRGERVMDVCSHLRTERIVYLGTPIAAGVANVLIAQLLHLESDGPEADIQLYVNCEGGDPSAMLAAVDTMRYVRPDVATTCVGQAVAVGAVLLAAGSPRKRAAPPRARRVRLTAAW